MKINANKKGLIVPIIASMLLSLVGVDSNAMGTVKKIEGSTRIETSIMTILESNDKVENLVVANGYSFADSLSSLNIMNAHPNTKLILTSKYTDLQHQLTTMRPKKVFLIGGTDTLDPQMERDIANENIAFERISGSSRYETNAKTLERFSQVGVADGRNYPDALSASALLKKENLGLMLVNGSKNYSTNKKVVYTFGQTVKTSKGTRLAGRDRYETNEIINKKLDSNRDNIITYGGNYADALSSANLLNGSNKVVLLNNRTISNFNAKLLESGENVIIGGLLKKLNDDIINASNGQYVPSNTQTSPSQSTRSNKKFNFDFAGPIRTQNDLDKAILTRYVQGIGQSGETVKLENSDLRDVSPFVKVLIEDTGYLLYTSRNGNEFSYSLMPTMFFNGVYDRDDFLNNIRFVRENLAKSGALDKNKSTYNKYIDSVMYMKLNMSYFKDDNLNPKISSSSPNSLYLHKSASCLGYAYYTNMAALLMQIPSYTAIGGTSTGYHAENIFIDDDNQSVQINSTGVTNPDRYSISSIRGTLDPTVVEYYINYSSSRDYEFHKIRQRLITRDIYKNLNN